MKIKERGVTRVSQMVLKWFREVSEHPGMVRNGPGSVRNGFGHIWKVRKDRKVMEGSGSVRHNPGYLSKYAWFHNRCSHGCLMGQEVDHKSNSDSKRKQFWRRFWVTKSYSNLPKLWSRFVDDLGALATYKRSPRVPL